MRYFPLTEVANLGGSECGRTFDEWRCRLAFDRSATCRREHMPEYVDVDQATLTLDGAKGSYLIEFPRKCWRVELDQSPLTIDVSDAIAVGRHTYRITPPEAGRFSATLAVSVRRPVVDTRDEGYVISYEAMKYSHRNWLEDDRSEQRVGRFDLYLKTIPQHYADTQVAASVSLDGVWRYRQVEPTSIEDYSGPDVDDAAWDEIDVPHTWAEALGGCEGPVWYRKRISVPADWRGRKVALRFSGVDDEPVVFVNAQQLGYNCGWHRPFQIDVGEHLIYGGENTIAVLLRSRRGLGRGAGVTYSFVRDWSITTYPDRDEPVGGIYGRDNEIAVVEHFGSVVFEPRIYPKFEGLIRVCFARRSAGGSFPLAMDHGSELVYRPPLLHYRALRAGREGGTDLKATVGCDRNVVLFEGQARPDADGQVQVKVEVYPFKFQEAVSIERLHGAVALIGRETGFRMLLSAAGCDAAGIDISIDKDRQDHLQCHVVTIGLTPDANGRFRFAIASGRDAGGDMEWLDSLDDPVAHLVEQWEQRVYGWAVPLKMSSRFAASLRACKQVLTLTSQLLEDRPSGMLTDLIKYPIFWLRDAAISIPGALYSGDIARRAAVACAGEVYQIARQNMSITVVHPDGSLRGAESRGYGRQVSSDSSQLAVYAIYKAWCQAGDDWLRQYYPTVKSYLAYSNELETMFDNRPDGIIRSSDGDWYDFAYKGRYEREGASLFVNVAYLRALKYGSRMARAVGDEQNAERWQKLYESGRGLITRSIAEGGLLVEQRGYLADTIQTLSDSHPNGWNYPDDLDAVTVFAGFRPMPHCVAIHEGIVQDRELIKTVVENIDRYDVIRPYPGLVQFPWNDYMAAEGQAGEYEQTQFGRRWKCLPGCHAAGGRWAFAGGLIQLGLWDADAEDLAREAKENQAGYLTLARQPARIYEDAHYSGLFRNQAGDPKDTEGFYYNWGSATPLQAMVEGEYGLEPTPRGVRIDPRHCRVGDGITNVAIRGGRISYRAESRTAYLIDVDTSEAGELIFVTPDPAAAARAKVRIKAEAGDFRAGGHSVEADRLIVRYGERVRQIAIEW